MLAHQPIGMPLCRCYCLSASFVQQPFPNTRAARNSEQPQFPCVPLVPLSVILSPEAQPVNHTSRVGAQKPFFFSHGISFSPTGGQLRSNLECGYKDYVSG